MFVKLVGIAVCGILATAYLRSRRSRIPQPAREDDGISLVVLPGGVFVVARHNGYALATAVQLEHCDARADV